jgi:hypothetical protein
MVTGYMHPRYAESLAEFGAPLELPRCGGWILERPISGFAHHDGMGCYPLFACRDWSQLNADLDSLRDALVSLAIVADPFGEFDLTYLQRCFDVVLPFKQHFIVDLRQPRDHTVSKHHRRHALKSLEEVHVERCHDPSSFLDEWVNLYASLVENKRLRGIKAFSRTAFAKQLSTPGSVLFRAVYRGTTVGADWYYLQGDVSYGHLAAFRPEYKKLAVSYALQWFAIEYFASIETRWLDLGGGAGVSGDETDGLSFFKRGWSTGTRTAYFCGRVFDHSRYSEAERASNVSGTTYFPAYRKGEFD